MESKKAYLDDLLLKIGTIGARLAELDDVVDDELRGLRLASTTLTTFRHEI